ncbi:hypothetical protein OEZ85_002308 [Tetradesmus obliquus]|uniref:Endonuclease/exonuclease/phosphatase domain-containing protein n=1 Tax=Tetradesmus obliquus TaxID=3088 RepID=A0ABY8U2K3_TETOB|nr:hypothetical protein OEZ85_002308 [Tetradesmus obliquus]
MSCDNKTLLKIATLNVNGLKQSCQKVWDAKYDAANVLHLLEHLACDIVCLQEVKLSVADYAEFGRLVKAAGWDAYFSFARTFPSYSGVATFCKAALSPSAAEEGLFRVLPPQNAAAAAADAVAAAAATAAEERGSATCEAGAAVDEAAAAAAALRGIAAPWASDIPFPAAELAELVTAEEAAHLDSQGRCVITDHGLFVLLNVYLPACSNVIEQNRRAQFKMKCAMCKVLEARLRCLLAAGRHVLLAGDLNCLAWPQDCAAFAVAPHAQQVHFYDGSPCWAWLRSMLTHFHPTGTALFEDIRRPGRFKQRCCFTVWDPQYTKGNRVDKYGCRADFILLGDAAHVDVLTCNIVNELQSKGTHCKRFSRKAAAEAAAAAAAAAAADTGTGCRQGFRSRPQQCAGGHNAQPLTQQRCQGQLLREALVSSGYQPGRRKHGDIGLSYI